MMSAYDRWATRTPADWDDELAYLAAQKRARPLPMNGTDSHKYGEE